MEKNMLELENIHTEIKKELQRSIDFWLKNGQDEQYGGVYTCVDVAGRVYSTDKSVWMQGRCAWTFSRLCNLYGEKQEWKKFAKSCLDFSEKYCINRNAGNRMYFTVTEDGKPLRQRRYCFSEGFYTIANAEYYALTGDREYLERARAAWNLIWDLTNGLIQDPTGLGPKTCPETRSGRALANPMIYLNLCMILLEADPEHRQEYLEKAKESANFILNFHFKPELKATLESVGMNGEFISDVTEGRVVNPGHDIECAWFLLQYAKETGDILVQQKAIEMFDFAYESGWDKEYGGLLYYIDALGNPPEAYEHDMKLWWPHNELLIASMMIYQLTQEEKYVNIFKETWAYCMKFFKEEEYGEWYGYLRRDGKPTLPAAKGSTFKGPFHLPRMLMMVDKMLDTILEK